MQGSRLNKHQRFVLVVGLGVGLYLIGTWISTWNSYLGWAGYGMPRRVFTYSFSGSFRWQPWQLLLIWLALTLVWVIASLWIVRIQVATAGNPEGPRPDLSASMWKLRLNPPQRIVVVIGLGVTLYVVGQWVMTWGTHLYTGWTGYAPLQRPYAGGLHPWVQLLLWVTLIGIWAGLSIPVLRSPSSGADY